MKTIQPLLVALLLAAAPARADWVVLTDGRQIRGIDYQKRGDGYLFTVESGKTAYIPAKHVASFMKSPADEKVTFRGKEVPLREMILTLKRERKALQATMVSSIERWARGGAGSDQARADVMAQPSQEQELFLGMTLAQSGSDPARALAARELARFKTKHAGSALAMSAVADKSATVRSASLAALAALKDPQTGERFVPYLLARNKDLRTRASLALRKFPTYRAVPALIVSITKIWTGGGRSYFFQGTQRAYISDYELVSGGTTFTLTEAADPIIKFAETGVVLDAKIVRSEERLHATTLETITGQTFGLDAKKWESWWKESGEALALRAAEDAAARERAAAERTPPGDAASGGQSEGAVLGVEGSGATP